MLLGCTYIGSNFRANIWVIVSPAIQSYQIFENKVLSIAVKFTQSICFDPEFQILVFRKKRENSKQYKCIQVA